MFKIVCRSDTRKGTTITSSSHICRNKMKLRCDAPSNIFSTWKVENKTRNSGLKPEILIFVNQVTFQLYSFDSETESGIHKLEEHAMTQRTHTSSRIHTTLWEYNLNTTMSGIAITQHTQLMLALLLLSSHDYVKMFMYSQIFIRTHYMYIYVEHTF